MIRNEQISKIDELIRSVPRGMPDNDWYIHIAATGQIFWQIKTLMVYYDNPWKMCTIGAYEIIFAI